MHATLFPEFVWSVGEEGSDPVVDVDGRRHRHDQYAQSGHYEHMEQDLRTIAGLGVEVVRYGMPWRLTEPEAGRYAWSLWDRALGACADAGLRPVVDLLHFGLPDHSPGFADPSWIDGFVRYVEAFLGRYREPMWFTPINEPGVTAAMTARFGLWNDRLANAADHARVLANVVLANLEALTRIVADRDASWIGSEGFDVHVDPTGNRGDTLERRRALSWLVWDLHLGCEPLPAAAQYLDPVDDATLSRIRDLASTTVAGLVAGGRVIAGHDFYPISVQAVDASHPAWSIAERVRFGMTELRRWHDRYRVPFWIAETSNLSLPVEDQISWLRTLTDGVEQLRHEHLPVRGICWYSRGDQYDWQTALTQPFGVVTEVGLLDAQRRPRPVAAVLAASARASHDAHS